MIATDLDGTLLNSQKIISPANMETLHKAHARGIQLVIATGRFWGDARNVLKPLDIPYYLISSNGACIHDPYGRQIYSGSINREAALHAFHWLHENRYYFELTTENGIYAWNSGWETMLEELPILKAVVPEADTDRLHFLITRQATQKVSTPLCSLEQIAEIVDPFYNVLIIAFDPARRTQARNYFSDCSDLQVSSSWDYNIELLSPVDSKGSALKRVSQILGISLDDTAAVGDHENDLSMLSAVRWSIAMENGDESVRKQCRMITKSQNDDGFSWAIEHILSDLGL